MQTYDWRCQVRGPRPVSDKIAIIEISTDALTALGAWPFDREYHAYLIQALTQAGAKAIIFDVLFSDPLEKNQIEKDQKVIEAAKASQSTYFPYAFADYKSSKGFFSSNRIISSILPDYKNVAHGVGFVNIIADIDGKRRRTMPVISFEKNNYYQLSFVVAADLLGSGIKNCVFVPRKYFEISPELKVPLDDDSSFIISYAGLWQSKFYHYSYLDIVKTFVALFDNKTPTIDLSELKDKICIVGLTSIGSHDTSPTPVQSVYPMVGAYANILNDILERDFIYRVGRWQNLLLLLLFSLLIGWITVKRKPIEAMFYVMAIGGLFIGFAVLAFCWKGVWFDIFYPMVIFSVVYVTTTFYRTLIEMRKREILENELKIASQIQKSFLPQFMPATKGLAIAVHFRPAKAVGGDLYSFINFKEDAKIGVMVGDVSGKGTPAALFMAKTVSEFKFSSRNWLDPSQALEQVNNAIASESTGGLFVTMCYAIFDVEGRSLVMSNGGHLPIAAVTAQGKTSLLSAEDGMPIGVMEGVVFSTARFPLNPGDVLAIYSDGVSEARNWKKEEYGVENLQKIIKLYRKSSANEIMDKAVEHLNQFMGSTEQHDDITLILVKMDEAPL